MARPHIEFVQSQNIPWADRGDGSAIKILNADSEGVERTILLRLPAHAALTATDVAQEAFVLDGQLTVAGAPLPRHGYLFRPASDTAAIAAGDDGAIVLICSIAAGDPAAAGQLEWIDAAAMPWDTSVLDPKLTHLRLARKILRLGANGSGRTYLLAGLPHGRPQGDDMPIERHPHAEEMFLIHGEMSAPEGVMTTGAYFYRPAGIDHGPHISDLGFLMFMRTPGSGRIVTDWRNERRPLPIDAPYRPVLPPGTPASWSQSRPTWPEY